MLFNSLVTKQKFSFSVYSILWLVYVCGGLAQSIFSQKNQETIIEFLVAVFMGVALCAICAATKQPHRYIKPLKAICVVVIVGCFAQMLVPDWLVSLKDLTMSLEKQENYRDFYVGGYLAGFSFQTGITGFYLAIFSGICWCNFL